MTKCELIKDGVVIERFFRDEDIDEARASVEMFQWPEGEWQFTDV